MDDIYFNCLLTKKLNIESKYLDENIDNYIEKYLKNKVEGFCIDEGYIEPETVKIITKSVGSLLGSRFTGDVTYNIAYSANVCNPMIGNIIDCKVKFINKVGILGNNGPLTILIARYINEDNDIINKINENDIIKVEIIAKKFYLNSKEIKIIGKIWNKNNDEKENKKINKKNFASSDLTPINNDEEIENEFLINEDEDNGDLEDDNMNELSDDDDLDNSVDEDDYEDDDEENKNLHIENPDENNLDDIEIDEDFEEDDDIDSSDEFE